MNAVYSTADWSRGRLEIVHACPICGESGTTAEYARRDDSLAMPDVWRMARCAGCRSIYLVDKPDSESLARAYTGYYTHDSEQEDLDVKVEAGLVARLVNGYLNVRFRMGQQPALHIGMWLFKAIPPLRMKLDVYGRHVRTELCSCQTRLLDVGCGNGAFLLRARSMGIRVQGCEPDPVAAETCKQLGLDVHNGDVWTAGYPAKAFNYITLNHVIEHVSDAPSLLEKLGELLKPGGVLWLALPNPNALGISLFESGWKGLHPPYHLQIPSQPVLRRWLQEAGLIEVRFVRRGVQSPGLWRESTEIAQREGTAPPSWRITFVRRVGDVLSTFSPRWGEETIIMARRPIDQ